MTDEGKQLLNTFETRLRHLTRRKMQADYDELNRRYNDLKTATAISLDGSDVKETKQRLTKLVREVDKCIALLNE